MELYFDLILFYFKLLFNLNIKIIIISKYYHIKSIYNKILC